MLACSIPVWQYTWSIANPSSPHLQCPEFLLGLHYLGMISWLNSQVLELISSPLPHSSDPANTTWSKRPTITHLISINYEVLLKGPSLTTKTLLLLGKFQGFRGFLTGAGDKGQTSPWPQPNSLLYTIIIR